MTSDRLRVLEAAIQRTIRPDLTGRGFSYEAATRTFRRPAGECTQIVDFQVGVRSAEGTFAVNLAVFHPEYRAHSPGEPVQERPREFHCLPAFRQRLSFLRDTPMTKVFGKIIGDTDTFLKWWLVTPGDKWWPFTSDEAQVTTELEAVRALLLTRGMGWLDLHSNVALLKTAHETPGAAQRLLPNNAFEMGRARNQHAAQRERSGARGETREPR